uniref:Retrotransposon gag domain-containing protein n=1 Tax=Fagus sylvatica TaxID=28930 RepID=A0A2N9H9X5_FAGSY
MRIWCPCCPCLHCSLPSFLMRHPMRSSSYSKRASLCWIDWMRTVTSRSTSSYSCLLCFLLMWLLLMSPLQVELFQLTPPADIILPSWSVPLYQADGSLRERAITRHTNVLGYPVPEDTSRCHPCGPKLHVPAVWEHEDHDDRLVFGTIFLGLQGAAVEVLKLIQRLLSLTMMKIGGRLETFETLFGSLFDTPTSSPTSSIMAEERVIPPEAPRMTMYQLLHPTQSSIPSCIMFPPNAPHVEIKQGLMAILPDFRGLENENPYVHVRAFEEVIGSFYAQNVIETAKLRFFPFSFKDKAKVDHFSEVVRLREEDNMNAKISLLTKEIEALKLKGSRGVNAVYREDPMEACRICQEIDHTTSATAKVVNTDKFEEVKSITILRSGKEIGNDAPKANEKSKETPAEKDESGIAKSNDIEKCPFPTPFPQALKLPKNLDVTSEILEHLHQVKVNLPLLHLIKQMPLYAKVIKDLCTVKRKHHVKKTAFLTEQVNAIIQRKFPPKYKDPGCPTISCTIEDYNIERALLDLGASVNLLPFSVYLQLGLSKTYLCYLTVSRPLCKEAEGVVEDVLVKVENFYYPVDFIILDIEPTLHPSANIPIILGRPFLATANALINCRNGRMKITFGSMTAELNIFNVNPQQLVDEECEYILEEEQVIEAKNPPRSKKKSLLAYSDAPKLRLKKTPKGLPLASIEPHATSAVKVPSKEIPRRVWIRKLRKRMRKPSSLRSTKRRGK